MVLFSDACSVLPTGIISVLRGGYEKKTVSLWVHHLIPALSKPLQSALRSVSVANTHGCPGIWLVDCVIIQF